MKILVLDPADFLGGAEIFSVELMNVWAEKHEVCVVTSGKCQSYLKKLSPKIRVKVFSLPRLRPFRPITFFKTLIILRRFIKKENISVLHSNSVRASLFLPFLPARIRTHFQHDFTFPKKFIFSLRHVDRVFCCSRFVEANLIQKGLSSFHTMILHNGIDLSLFSHISKIPALRPRIGLLARFDEWKGHTMFLEIATLLPEYDFLIFGESVSHDEKTILFEEKIRKKAGENIFFRGFLPSEKAFTEIDFLLHLSLKKEPFGRVIIEALASNTPLLASKNGGAREILNTTLLQKHLIDPRDTETVAKKIRAFYTDKKWRVDFYRELHQRREDFELQKKAGEMEHEWEDLLSSVSLL